MIQFGLELREPRLCSTIGQHESAVAAAAISCHGLVVSAAKLEETSTQPARHSTSAADGDPAVLSTAKMVFRAARRPL